MPEIKDTFYMALLIQNGHLVDPKNKKDEVCDILIEDGKVTKVGKGLKAPSGAKTLDASGMVVMPGLIDMHVHFREPGFEYKETVATGAEAAVSGGFTSVACMANTDPVNDNESITRFIKKRADEAGLANVFPIGAISKGLKGEGLAGIGEMVEAGAVAISDDGMPVMDPELFRRALEYSKVFDIAVINHAEDCHLGAGGVMHEGAVSTELGLPGLSSAVEDVMVSRDIELAALTGARLHVPHLSTRRSLDLVRSAKKRKLRVTCEVAPHHLLLTDELLKSFDTNLKMKPPLRSEDDCKALMEGLADGAVDVIATDHAPHHWDEKVVEFSLAPFGIVGLETSLSLIHDKCVKAGVITLTRMAELMSLNPAKVLKLDGKGHLGEGADGDVTIFDPKKKVSIKPEAFKSRSKNSPFGGWKLTGAPTATVVAGRIVYQA